MGSGKARCVSIIWRSGGEGRERERMNYGFEDLKSILGAEDGAVLIHVRPEKHRSWWPKV